MKFLILISALMLLLNVETLFTVKPANFPQNEETELQIMQGKWDLICRYAGCEGGTRMCSIVYVSYLDLPISKGGICFEAHPGPPIDIDGKFVPVNK